MIDKNRWVDHMAAETAELRQLIMEHPDWPIMVVVGEEANTGDYSHGYANSITITAEEVLDYSWNDTKVYTDRDELEEDVIDQLLSEDLSEEEIEKKKEEELERLEPYWRNVITIWAD